MLAELLDFISVAIDGDGGPGEPIIDFFRERSSVESDRVMATWTTARALEAGDREGAAKQAEMLVRSMPDEDDEHGAMVIRTFAETLLGRCRAVSSSGGNLYLGARPPGAQLRAFELLRLRTPLIPFAYAAANKAIISAIDPGAELTLIDVGVGRGGQIKALLRNPQARAHIARLHVVGVEPDSDPNNQGALEMAREQVLATAAEVGVDVRFSPVARRAEALRAEDFPPMSGRVIANAAFALQHIPPQEGRPGESKGLDRIDVLRLLRELGAETMVLTEPDTDHVEDRLRIRLLFAYRHYRTVAASLEAMLAPADAQLVFSEFFAPEVRNVVGHDGQGRSERHERSYVWADHLARAGWQVTAPGQLVPTAGTPRGFTLDVGSQAFRLLFAGVPLLSALRATR
ncbi:MAG: hypothetical protein KC457_13485 [Myxococcales bacterium]|nr:hypothetical protein [Myxococcales bacterium]